MKKLVLLFMLISATVFAEDEYANPEVKNENFISEISLHSTTIYKVYNVHYFDVKPEKGGPAMYTCSITLSSGGGTATGHGIGDTLEEACHNATDNALNGGWSWDF